MKDYNRSIFWGVLRKINVYPHDVRMWRSKVVTWFHVVTFGVFFNQEKAWRGIREAIDSLPSDEDSDRIERSL